MGPGVKDNGGDSMNEMRFPSTTRRASAFFCAIVAMLVMCGMSGAAEAADYDPYAVTSLPTGVLDGTRTDPAVFTGMKVRYSTGNAARFSSSNIQTQCISGNFHTTWYGLTARQCKAADATKAQFTVFNSKTGKAVSKVNLKDVPLPPIGKSVPLQCVAAVARFLLAIPGTPGSTVGWMLKGATLLLKAAGIAVNC